MPPGCTELFLEIPQLPLRALSEVVHLLSIFCQLLFGSPDSHFGDPVRLLLCEWRRLLIFRFSLPRLNLTLLDALEAVPVFKLDLVKIAAVLENGYILPLSQDPCGALGPLREPHGRRSFGLGGGLSLHLLLAGRITELSGEPLAGKLHLDGGVIGHVVRRHLGRQESPPPRVSATSVTPTSVAGGGSARGGEGGG